MPLYYNDGDILDELCLLDFNDDYKYRENLIFLILVFLMPLY